MNFFDVRFRTGIFVFGLFLTSGLFGSVAMANGYDEDESWQFQTSSDMANLAAVQTMIQEKKAGMFKPNKTISTYNYNTTIDHETNCSISSEALGNNGSNGMSGNSSSPQGVNADSTGNASTNSLGGSGSSSTPGSLADSSTNSGAVNAKASGDTTSSVGGNVDEALNSSQSNNGAQTSTLSNNTACEASGGGSLN